MNPKRKALLEKFIDENNLTGISIELLNQALTHKSYANELKSSRKGEEGPLHNQRLEFLGDAILGLVIAQSLFEMMPEANEGELTKRKSMAVCEPTLAEIGEKLQLGSFLLLGKGEVQTGGLMRTSNIADALESVIASIFNSLGIDSTREFILKHWMPYLKESRVAMFSVDHKSILQEIIVKAQKIRPEYKLVSTSGPEHKKIFLIALYINGKKLNEASANSRKKAEQKAAFDYLKKNNLI